MSNQGRFVRASREVRRWVKRVLWWQSNRPFDAKSLFYSVVPEGALALSRPRSFEFHSFDSESNGRTIEFRSFDSERTIEIQWFEWGLVSFVRSNFGFIQCLLTIKKPRD